MVLATLMFSLGLTSASADALAFPGQAPLADVDTSSSKLVNLTIREIICDSQWNGIRMNKTTHKIYPSVTKCIGKWHREPGQVETQQSCNCCRNTTDFCDCTDRPAVVTASYPHPLSWDKSGRPLPPRSVDRFITFDDGGHLEKQAVKYNFTKDDIQWGLTGGANGFLNDRAQGSKIWMENEDNFVSIYAQFPTDWSANKLKIPIDLMWTKPVLSATNAVGGTKPYTKCLHQRGRLEFSVVVNIEKWFHANYDGKSFYVPSTEMVPMNVTISGVPGPSNGELPGLFDLNQEYVECQYVTPPNPHAICL